MSNEIKYPNVEVELIGQDGNAFAILGAVKKALKKNNVPQAEIDLYFAEATAGDYNHLLQVTMKWVTIQAYDEDEQDDYGYLDQKNFD